MESNMSKSITKSLKSSSATIKQTVAKRDDFAETAKKLAPQAKLVAAKRKAAAAKSSKLPVPPRRAPGAPSSDAKTLDERRALVKSAIAAGKSDKSPDEIASDNAKSAAAVPASEPAIPAFLDRKQNGVAPVSVTPKITRDVLPATLKGVETKPKLPLEGKAALQAIAATSSVPVTKVPTGMTSDKAAKLAAKMGIKPASETSKPASKSASKSKSAKSDKPAPAKSEQIERAEKVLKLNPRKPNKGERARYDWKAAREAAAKGKLPVAPDFSANTHRSYRPALAAVVELVAKRDLAGLQAHKVHGTCSSPQAIKKFREIAILALKSK
jgi:hypothetical protein